MERKGKVVWFILCSKKSKKHKHKSSKKHKKSGKENEELKDEQKEGDKEESKRDRNYSFNVEENNEMSFQKDIVVEKREKSQPPSGFKKKKLSNQQESD